MKIALALLLCLSLGSALNTIVRKGNLLFDSVTGNQFWVKGVDYQPKNSIGQNYDVLADPNTLNRDLPYLTGLGINAIRVYETNSSLNHDVCMQILDANGIYVILDVPTPSTSITSENPMWNLDLFAPFAAKIDAFASYGNILGYIASNEVSTRVNNTGASAFVKAAVRDVKAYVRSKGLSTPVGYAIADAGDIAANQEAYFACSTNPADDPDFYGINIYRWCGNSTYQLSGYDVVTNTFTDWPIAVMFSEYGCNVPRTRYFDEVLSLYSTNMTGVFSGGLVYEYSNETNDYGLVVVNYGTNTITPLSDWTNYKNKLAQVNGTSSALKLDTYNPTLRTIACPAVNASAWLAAASPLPPAVDAAYCNCILSSLTCRFNASSSSEVIALAPNVTNIYSFLCGLKGGVYCTNISTNATSGVYGMLSPCDALTRISATMDAYYQDQSTKDATTCGFGGFGRLQTASTTSCSMSSTSTSPSVTRVTITTSNSADSSMTASTFSTSSNSASNTAATSTTASGSSSGTRTVSTTSGSSVTGTSSTRSNSITVITSQTSQVSSASMMTCAGLLMGAAALLL